MRQRTVRRVLAAGALAACLAVAAPVEAGQGPPGSSPALLERVWSWLEPLRLLLSTLSGEGGVQRKEGLGVDPDGAPRNSGTGGGSPVCEGTQCGEGAGPG